MNLRTLLVALMSIASTQAAKAANAVVVMETSMGTIKIELFEDKAPITVKNFLDYVDDKHYDGTVFHRVISTFMIQGGGYDASQKERKTKPAIKNEAKASGLKNERGTIAMARTDEPDTATCQFFINVRNNTGLDPENERSGHGYAVFGRVIDGMDVVDKIKNVKTGRKGMFAQDCPQEDVVIKSVRRADK
jgi:cyclophilin family peptidyl-prolyl cis-trans isomerase